MAELVQITLSDPIVEDAKPATDEVVYDKLWLKTFNVSASSPKNDARLRAVLTVCRDTDEGKELKSPEVTKSINIEGLFATLEDETISVETRTAIGAAMNQLLTALTMYGQEKNII